MNVWDFWPSDERRQRQVMRAIYVLCAVVLVLFVLFGGWVERHLYPPFGRIPR